MMIGSLTVRLLTVGPFHSAAVHGTAVHGAAATAHSIIVSMRILISMDPSLTHLHHAESRKLYPLPEN